MNVKKIKEELLRVGYQIEVTTKPIIKNSKWIGEHDFLVAQSNNPDINKVIKEVLRFSRKLRGLGIPYD